MPYVFEAVKGQQRTTEYYQVNLNYGEVATLVELPEEFLGDDLFDHELTMQRKLSWTRVRDELVPYLGNDDAFFSSLSLFMIPRDMEAMEEGEGFTFEPVHPNSNIGKLTVTSSISLFPGDGQHRAASIKEALKKWKHLANVQVPVVLIPFRSRGDVRQKFSDLNLNAKPVNKSIGHSFETRNPLALVAKDQEKLVPLFTGRVNHGSNSLPASSGNVITVNTLYNMSELLLKALGISPDNLRKKPEEIAEASKQVADIINEMVKALPAWNDVKTGATKPSDVREKYVFAHGIGWQTLAHVAAVLAKEKPNTWSSELGPAIKNVDWQRSNPDWHGVSMVGTRMNNTGPGIRATAGYVLNKAGVTSGEAAKYVDQYHASVSGSQPSQPKAA